ncbi:MAG: hypothetical protein ACR2MT_08305 [Aurantibacter sp.]
MKYLALFFLLAALWSIYLTYEKVPDQKNRPVAILIQEGLKEQAFSVLRDKCNVCHATKKKTDIFTPENMDSLAPDIHKQVFVKRKMPKGRKVKLTEEEAQHLKVWLDDALSEK